MLRNTYIRHVLKQLRYYSFRRKWRKQNMHNETTAMNIFCKDNVSVGSHSYGGLNVVSFADNHKLRIGKYVSIAQNVHFLLDAEHYTDRISSYPFKVKLLRMTESEAFGKGDIIVDDDVWIGYGATVLSGVHIGQGAVIAAGAIVTADIPPYAIAGGIPAKVIKYRFPDEIIQELLMLDYEKFTKELVSDHIEDLYSELQDVSQLTWVPKKNSGLEDCKDEKP